MFGLLCVTTVAILLNFGTDGANDATKPPDISVCFGNNTKNVRIRGEALAIFKGPFDGAKGDLCDDTLNGCQALCLKLSNCLAITFIPKHPPNWGSTCVLFERNCNEAHSCSRTGSGSEYWQRTDTNGTHPQCPKAKSPKLISNNDRSGVTGALTTPSAKSKKQPPNIANCFGNNKKGVQVRSGHISDFSAPFQGSNGSASDNLYACQSLCLKEPTCLAINILPPFIPLCLLFNTTCTDKDCIKSEDTTDYWQRTDTKGTHPQCPKTKSPKLISNTTKAKTQPPSIADCFGNNKKSLWVNNNVGLISYSTAPFQGSNGSESENLNACQSLCLKEPECRSIILRPRPFPSMNPECQLFNVTCTDTNCAKPQILDENEYWQRLDSKASLQQCHPSTSG